MPNATPTSTKAIMENLGRGIRSLVLAHGEPYTYESDAAFGKQLDGMIAAALKAAVEGRQTSKQMKVRQEKARQAFARRLARRVALLPPVAS